jgi:hypothetical protein
MRRREFITLLTATGAATINGGIVQVLGRGPRQRAGDHHR